MATVAASVAATVSPMVLTTDRDVSHTMALSARTVSLDSVVPVASASAAMLADMAATAATAITFPTSRATARVVPSAVAAASAMMASSTLEVSVAVSVASMPSGDELAFRSECALQ